MRKKFIIAFCIGLFSLVGIETVVYFLNRPKYVLHLPSLEKLESINVEETKIKEMEQMKEILNLLNPEIRTTKEESIQDSPVNTGEQIKIDFHFIESGTSTLYVYRKNKDFYIEQPYNGIYKITKEEYNRIKEFSLEK